jgi:hypothetical protein
MSLYCRRTLKLLSPIVVMKIYFKFWLTKYHLSVVYLYNVFMYIQFVKFVVVEMVWREYFTQALT